MVVSAIRVTRVKPLALNRRAILTIPTIHPVHTVGIRDSVSEESDSALDAAERDAAEIVALSWFRVQRLCAYQR